MSNLDQNPEPCFLDCGNPATETVRIRYHGETTDIIQPERVCEYCREELAAKGELG